jgi:uncharacterized protein with NRDE domain
MCLILTAHMAHSRYRLVVAANRDEFLSRPTAPAAFWPHASQILGGRDLEKGGSWMGIAADGRWAAVTNFRDGRNQAPGTGSRGELVRDFLLGVMQPAEYASSLQHTAERFSGFNLLWGDHDQLYYASNRVGAPPGRLAQGVYGLSNGLLDAPWPKVERGKPALRRTLSNIDEPMALTEALLELLSDQAQAGTDTLPDTGIDRDAEKLLSAAFICAPGYGTRASTVLLIEHTGQVYLCERSFPQDGKAPEDRRFQFIITGAANPPQGD